MLGRRTDSWVLQRKSDLAMIKITSMVGSRHNIDDNFLGVSRGRKLSPVVLANIMTREMKKRERHEGAEALEAALRMRHNTI
jgi:hypothetical protein